jgi:hypothetical protein
LTRPSADPDLTELTSAVQRLRETYAQPVNDIVARIRERRRVSINVGARKADPSPTARTSSDCSQ